MGMCACFHRGRRAHRRGTPCPDERAEHLEGEAGALARERHRHGLIGVAGDGLGRADVAAERREDLGTDKVARRGRLGERAGVRGRTKTSYSRAHFNPLP